jgi:hypothetical protein
MFPFSDGVNPDRLQGFRHVFLQRLKGVVTILAKEPFHSPPEEFDEIQLTVKLRKED